MSCCEIQWIDSRGEPTPDANPAVGVAVCEQWHGGEHTLRRFLICAEHLRRMPPGLETAEIGGRTHASCWTFDPFAPLQLPCEAL